MNRRNKNKAKKCVMKVFKNSYAKLVLNWAGNMSSRISVKTQYTKVSSSK